MSKIQDDDFTYTIAQQTAREYIDMLGKIVWNAYCHSTRGRAPYSTFTGDNLPEWDKLDPDIKEHVKDSALALRNFLCRHLAPVDATP